MDTHPAAQAAPKTARDRICDLYSQLLIPQVQRIIRTHLLTTAQQRQAESATGWELIKMWARFQLISDARAVIELALLVDLITQAEAIGLRRAIGDQGGMSIQPDKPHWDRDRGELYFAAQLVRKVPRPSIAKNIVAILDAFQLDGWPARIDDPLSGGADPQRRREAIATLNEGLEIMRFRADGNSDGIVWEVR